MIPPTRTAEAEEEPPAGQCLRPCLRPAGIGRQASTGASDPLPFPQQERWQTLSRESIIKKDGVTNSGLSHRP